ncbi:hypothetical protein BV20DRAFT_974095 [Pilatotrama ljubarskyi]|nr:hypothetical protein BV20DRAFT_974095 [Pilatotrama ljubarskyi]
METHVSEEDSAKVAKQRKAKKRTDEISHTRKKPQLHRHPPSTSPPPRRSCFRRLPAGGSLPVSQSACFISQWSVCRFSRDPIRLHVVMILHWSAQVVLASSVRLMCSL